MVTSEKYKGRTIYFNHPHLICMANYMPEVKAMTKDRWDIRALQNDIVVKRYLAGKVIFEHPSIDPYVKHSLEEIDRAYSPEEYPQARAEPPQENLQTRAEVVARPLNIKGTGGFNCAATRFAGTRCARTSGCAATASRELAALAQAAAPQPARLPPISALPPLPGRIINGVYYQLPERPSTPPSLKL